MAQAEERLRDASIQSVEIASGAINTATYAGDSVSNDLSVDCVFIGDE